MAKKKKTIEELMSAHMSKIGKKGAEANKKKGSKYFSDLVKKRWAKKKQK